MAKTIFTGEKIKKFAFKNRFPFLQRPAQNALGSLKISSCVTVHAAQAMGIANKKSADTWLLITSIVIDESYKYYIFNYFHKFEINRIDNN